MSKSLGNSPDPLELIDKYGADGLRFGLMRIAPRGQDIRFDEKQIEEGRNFATKLWNVARFRQMHGPSDAAPRSIIRALSIYALELIARLNETIDASKPLIANISSIPSHNGFMTLSGAIIATGLLRQRKPKFSAKTRPKRNPRLAVMDFVFSANVAIAASLHAAHYRGALVVAGPWKRFNSICCATRKDRLE